MRLAVHAGYISEQDGAQLQQFTLGLPVSSSSQPSNAIINNHIETVSVWRLVSD